MAAFLYCLFVISYRVITTLLLSWVTIVAVALYEITKCYLQVTYKQSLASTAQYGRLEKILCHRNLVRKN